MIPTLDYDFGGPSARAANARKIPAISEAGDSRFGLQGIGRYLFNQFPAGSEAAIGATWAWSKGWRQPVRPRRPEHQLLEDLHGELQVLVGQAGRKVAGEDTFMNSDQSIASQITKMKSLVDANKVDFIFMGSYAPGGATATKQIRAAGINLPIIGGAGFDGTFWLGAVPNLTNFYVVAGGVTTGGDPNPLRAAVYAAYKAKFKKVAPLGEQTLNGYSAVYAFARAIERAKSTDGAESRGPAREVQERRRCRSGTSPGRRSATSRSSAACRSSRSSARRRSSSPKWRRRRASSRRHSVSQLIRPGRALCVRPSRRLDRGESR